MFENNNHSKEPGLEENNNPDKDKLVSDKVKFKTGKKIEGKKIKLHSSEKVSNFSVLIYKNLKLVIFIEVVLILFLGYFLVIHKQLSSINEYKDLVLQKENELNQAQKYKKTSSEFEKEYDIIQEQVGEDISKLYKILPPEKDLPNIMAQIEALVNKHGFNLGSISLSDEKNSLGDEKKTSLININKNVSQELIKEVNIQVFIFTEEGNYGRVKELLEAFENHIRFMDIISFSFENDMKAYSIILKTYYLNYEE